jgi:Protein of unknown function (DUF3109)
MKSDQPPIVVKGYTFSHELFEKGFPTGEGPCKCASTCCSGGVYADLRERDRILVNKDLVMRHMDETQNTDHRQWFEEQEEEDHDFPSGRCVGTEVFNDKCVFLNKEGHCSLQVAAVADGRHKWDLKPFYCVLFPIEISDRVVSFDPMLQDEESCCSAKSRFTIPLFEGCRDEIVHAIGEDGFRELQECYARRKDIHQLPQDSLKE